MAMLLAYNSQKKIYKKAFLFFMTIFMTIFITLYSKNDYKAEMTLKYEKNIFLYQAIRKIVLKNQFYIDESKTSANSFRIFIRSNDLYELELKFNELRKLILKHFKGKLQIISERIYIVSVSKKLLISLIATINFFIIFIGILFFYKKRTLCAKY